MNDLEILTQQLEETNLLISQLNSVSAYLADRHASLTTAIQTAQAEADAHAAALAAAEAEAAEAERVKWEAQKVLDELQQAQGDQKRGGNLDMEDFVRLHS